MIILLNILAGIILLISAAVLITVFSIKFDANHIAYESSWHWRLYKFLSFSGDKWNQSNKPFTICEYYWSFILRIVVLPLTLPILLLGSVFKKMRGPRELRGFTIIFWLYLFVSFTIGMSIYIEEDGLLYVELWRVILVGTGILTAITCFIAIVVFSIIGTLEMIRNRDRKYSKPKTRSIVYLKFKSWKDKNCPMIHWIN